DAPGLVAELRRLRTKYTAGSSSVVTPRAGGDHCDQAVALALAVHEHDRHGYVTGGTVRTGGEREITADLHHLGEGFTRRPIRKARWYDRGSGTGLRHRQF